MNEETIKLRLEVEELQHAYVQTIDDDDLEAWPDFFIDDCVYKIIPRENTDLGLPVAVIYCDSKGMLRDRIVALRKANIYAPHFYRHLVSNIRILGEQDGIIRAQSNYLVLQTLLDGDTKVYNAGKYVDEIVRVDGELKFKQKLCIFDTYRIQTLMVTPI
ncbi:MAG: aromatic-ring-hydroxylating dioxygenase subunit beta [Pseudomonadota bacterium]|nr:aromatic-ring-hydroxylating dioxygenase subunit beta [Pseudomonadota bacterium]